MQKCVQADFCQGLYPLQCNNPALVNTSKADKPHHRYYEGNPNVPKLTWLDLLGRAAISSDGHSLGKVEAVNSEFVVIKKGMTGVVRYWVPVKVLKQESSIADDGKLKFVLTQDQMQLYKKEEDGDIPNPSNFATLGASTSHMAYPPIPYLPDEMLKEKYRQQKAGSGREASKG